MIYKTLHKRLSNTNFSKHYGVNSVRVSSSCSWCGTCRVTFKRHQHHLIWKSCWTSLCLI